MPRPKLMCTTFGWRKIEKKTARLLLYFLVSMNEAKYSKATGCLEKDRDELLAFYDFPAEHWKHIRTTNPVESTFATVRHRTKRSKGCLSRETAFIMVFKLIKNAEKTWRRLDGKNQLPKVISGVKFSDGWEVIDPDELAA